MGSIMERVDDQGRISINKILNDTNIKPGDLVEVIPDKDKVVLKITPKDKPKDVIKKVAGKWKNRPDVVNEILSCREEGDREVSDFE